MKLAEFRKLGTADQLRAVTELSRDGRILRNVSLRTGLREPMKESRRLLRQAHKLEADMRKKTAECAQRSHCVA